MEPRWFVVTSRHGREGCALCHDWLPPWITDKRAKEDGVIRVVRLDTLETPEFWCSLTLTDLIVLYREGTLGNPAVIERQLAFERANAKWPLPLEETDASHAEPG